MTRAKKKTITADDLSLIEVSNDSGDHWVASIPTGDVKATEKSLRQAGAVRDDDEERLSRRYDAARVVANRDSAQYRYRSARVVDETEDLEDSYDREADESDVEGSEQSPVWKFG